MERRSEIRRATLDDVPACVGILRAWYDEHDWMPCLHSRHSMQQFWAGRFATADVWVALDGREIVGFCLRDGGSVGALYLAPQGRDRGIGAALLGQAKADQEALELWVFQANTAAIRFYDREGFHEIRRTTGDNEEGLPDILMHWKRG